MTTLVSTAITRARIAFPDLGIAIALDLLNDVHAEFLARYPLRQDVLMVPLTAEQEDYQLDDTAVKIETAYYRTGPNQAKQIHPLNKHEQDQMNPGWRQDASGVPQGYWLGSDLSSFGRIGLYPKPNDTTLLVTSATHPGHIVVTTNAAHGLTDGAAVEIGGVTGNANANGIRYIKATGLPSNQFSLYSNASLTTQVTGSGGYGGGGYVIGPGSPAVQLYIRRNTSLLELDTLPNCLLTIEPYVYSVCRRWAEMTLNPDEWQKWQRLEYDAIHKMELYLAERESQSPAVFKAHYVQPRRIF